MRYRVRLQFRDGHAMTGWCDATSAFEAARLTHFPLKMSAGWPNIDIQALTGMKITEDPEDA